MAATIVLVHGAFAEYVNAFAPEPGESCSALAAKFPGSMLGEETARPAPRRALPVSHPDATAHLVREAAVLRVAA